MDVAIDSMLIPKYNWKNYEIAAQAITMWFKA